MGCDIHYILEKKFKGGYLGVTSDLSYNSDARANNRDYDFFAEIAGVRGESSINKNRAFLPSDMSDLSLYYIMDVYSTDGHSHSYMPLSEFIDIFNRVNETCHSAYHLFKYELREEESLDDYRVIFFFDN